MIKYELLNDDNDNNNKKLHYFIFNIKWVYKSKYIIWLKYSLSTALGFQIVFNIHVKLEISHANAQYISFLNDLQVVYQSNHQYIYLFKEDKFPENNSMLITHRSIIHLGLHKGPA